MFSPINFEHNYKLGILEISETNQLNSYFITFHIKVAEF